MCALFPSNRKLFSYYKLAHSKQILFVKLYKYFYLKSITTINFKVLCVQIHHKMIMIFFIVKLILKSYMETLLYRTQMMELGTIITKRSVAQRGIILIAARLVETEQIEASTGFNLTWIIIIFTMKMFIIPVIWLYINRIFLTWLSLSLTQFYICKSLSRKQTIATLCIFF